MSTETNINPAARAEKLLVDAKAKGKLATLGAFCKLSGPGWMQSATTLGGGALATSLYLGVLGGFGFMWLQPLVMIFGIVMLSAISYITLSIGEKPMYALNREITPLLGYGWAGASFLACIVFVMPQFSLVVAAMEQNLASDFFSNFNPVVSKSIITGIWFALGMTMVVIYAFGGKGVKILEIFLKGSVAAIVISFFGVVFQLTFSGALDWGKIMAGFIPDLTTLSRPSDDFQVFLSMLGEESVNFWSTMIVSQQRDVIISATAMAVGINMTFLFPYSMLKKGWNKHFRGLSIFDLSTALFIPFTLASSCIVIAAASQFHATEANGLANARWEIAANGTANVQAVMVFDETGKWQNITSETSFDKALSISATTADGTAFEMPTGNLINPYIELLEKRLIALIGAENFAALTLEERVEKFNQMDSNEKSMAAMLVKRDASNLSETLAPLVGYDFANYIFGLGILAMATNSMLMNMLICGLSFAELFGKTGKPKWSILGSSILFFSAMGSVFLTGAKMWLVIYSGIVTMVLLPVAYAAFFVMMNSKKILKDSMPRGASRWCWNILMGISLAACSFAALYVLSSKLGTYIGPSIFAAFAVAVLISHLILKSKKN